MKLSTLQLEVLEKMVEGWELGLDSAFGVSCWLQKDGLGQGGDTQYINLNTFNALYKKGLVKAIKRSFPTTTYALTDKGKELA